MAGISPDFANYILNSPAAFPPEGVKADFEHPPSITRDGNVDAAICLTVASLAFFMRMYTKLYVLRQFVLEDYVLLLAYCLFVGFMGSLLTVVNVGLYNQWNLLIKDIGSYLWYFRIVGILYGITIAAVKVSILLQYLRIFVPTRKTGFMYWTCHILIWIHLVFYTICTFIEIFQCNPIKKAWDPLLYVSDEGSCLNINKLNISTASINIVSDFLILILPQHIIWRLQVSPRRKLGISAMFGVGILACISSILRLYYSTRLLTGTDLIRSTSLMGFWIAPEIACGILAAALPVSPKFFQSLRDSRMGTSLRTLISTSNTHTKTTQTLGSSATAWSDRAEKPKGSKADRFHVGHWEELPEEVEMSPLRGNPFRGSGEEEFGGRGADEARVKTLRAKRSDSHIRGERRASGMGVEGGFEARAQRYVREGWPRS